MPRLMCPHAMSLASGLCGAVLAPQKCSVDCEHNTRERASEKERAPNPGFLPSSLPHHCPQHGREVERSEDNREPSILTASSRHLSPTEISVFQLSANYSSTIPRTARATFKALHDLALTYFSCGDPVLTTVIPPLQHTPRPRSDTATPLLASQLEMTAPVSASPKPSHPPGTGQMPPPPGSPPEASVPIVQSLSCARSCTSLMW